MKNQKKRDALEIYEAAIREACTVRREAVAKAQSIFATAKIKATEVYHAKVSEGGD